MNMRVFILFWALIIVSSCGESSQYHKILGETMGTYYAITYDGKDPQKVKAEIDQLLIDFNNSLSTYIPSSLISKLNESETGIPLQGDIYFEPVLTRSDYLKKITSGKLNTAILPLLQYWRDKTTEIDTAESDRLLDVVRISKFEILDRNEGKIISKSPIGAKLDFSSLAKGYGIDIIAQYFNRNKVKNYLVDIGGEARASGQSRTNEPWKLAVNRPIEGSGLKEMELVVSLDNTSIATSGSYRQFYIKDGKKIAHIMDPSTGFSTISDLLSASIIADDCMTADGIATAMMVSTLEEAKSFLAQHQFPACLIYDADGDEKLEKYYANGFEALVLHAK